MATSKTLAHILIVDDEAIIRDSLAEFLSQEGFAVTPCGSAEEARTRARQTSFDVALCDVQLPGLSGLELLDRLLKLNPATLVLLITAYGTMETAVAAFRRGAHDYLMKPILLDEVLAKIHRLLAYRVLARRTKPSARSSPARARMPMPWWARVRPCSRCWPWSARSPRRARPCCWSGRAAPARNSSRGTIHRLGPHPEGRVPGRQLCGHSQRSSGKSALWSSQGAFTGADRDQTGVFLHAGNGTVFLDEIAEMSMATQAKLFAP